MALSDELEALVKRHGATSYRNRADTQNPAFGFSVAGLESLLAEVRKDDEALIEQMQDALEEILDLIDLLSPLECDTTRKVRKTITAARARLEGKP